jgi:hypothetical protein
MSRIMMLFALTVLPVALLSAQEVKPAQKPDANMEAGKLTLARLEQTARWTELFNGKDLTGWTGDTEGYIAKDGNLVCKAGGKNLYTSKEYSDFAFSFEFKLEESGNNGIGIRVPMGGHASGSGMEIQVLDHNGSKYSGEADMGGGITDQSTGSCRQRRDT